MLVFFDVNGARRSVKNTLSEATAASRSSLTSEYLGYRAADKNAPSKTTATSAPAKVPNASAATSGKFASAASEVLYSEVASLGVANNITCSTLTSEYSTSDAAEANLQEVAALAFGTFAGAEVAVVFDGAFLSAARYPRYSEVRLLLDAAVASDKVFFTERRAPFTSKKTNIDALGTLHNLGAFEKLTTTSRSRYFSLLSNLTEAELQHQNRGND